MKRALLFFALFAISTEARSQNATPALRHDIPADSAKQIFHSAEQMPYFAGSFVQFLKNNLQFPDEVREDTTIKGPFSEKVLVEFIVCEDGGICNVRIAKGSSYPALNREALRVMRLSPAWVPGKYEGAPVKVFYTLPIQFEMQ